MITEASRYNQYAMQPQYQRGSAATGQSAYTSYMNNAQSSKGGQSAPIYATTTTTTTTTTTVTTQTVAAMATKALLQQYLPSQTTQGASSGGNQGGQSGSADRIGDRGSNQRSEWGGGMRTRGGERGRVDEGSQLGEKISSLTAEDLAAAEETLSAKVDKPLAELALDEIETLQKELIAQLAALKTLASGTEVAAETAVAEEEAAA